MADAAPDEREQPGDTAPGDDERGGGGRFWSWVLGAVSLVGGLTWILLNLGAPIPPVDIAVGAVVALGGLVLLMPHRVRLPLRPAGLTGLGAGVAGTVAGLAVSATAVCCRYAYVEGRGFPFKWLSRGGAADDPETARRVATGAGWDVDWPTLLMSVFVWAYAGLLILTVITLVRRRR
ncbi:hypothetical protein [Actinoplanes sp. NPDC089786]|uniref:hypothetical protein n=1 Tax=Actinoplanes sp. NPDC089786 TaxID=3155185 RepID=UPI00341A1F55